MQNHIAKIDMNQLSLPSHFFSEDKNTQLTK